MGRAPWALKPPPQRHYLPWTAGEDAALLACASVEEQADLARRLGRTPKAARARRSLLVRERREAVRRLEERTGA